MSIGSHLVLQMRPPAKPPRKRVKNRYGTLSCPRCGNKTVMIEGEALHHDRFVYFRLHCSKGDFYGAWRRGRKRAQEAWNKGTPSMRDEFPG